MKKLICIAFCLSALAATPVLGQSTNGPTHFNLDFPGGTPGDLVKAIESATGKPLNAIIPTEDADTQLPPVKMNDVMAPQLFSALQSASVKTVSVQSWGNSYQQTQTGYGFRTSDNPVTDTSIWYFYAEK